MDKVLNSADFKRRTNDSRLERPVLELWSDRNSLTLIITLELRIQCKCLNVSVFRLCAVRRERFVSRCFPLLELRRLHIPSLHVQKERERDVHCGGFAVIRFFCSKQSLCSNGACEHAPCVLPLVRPPYSSAPKLKTSSNDVGSLQKMWIVHKQLKTTRMQDSDVDFGWVEMKWFVKFSEKESFVPGIHVNMNRLCLTTQVTNVGYKNVAGTLF